MNKRSVWLVAVLMMIPLYVGGLEITGTDDVNDLITHKKIVLNFNKKNDEIGIIKNSLQFSVDNPSISLVSWHYDAQPVQTFLSIFKKYQKLYTSSFAGWIACDCRNTNAITDSSLYISCLIVAHDGRIVPFTTRLRMGKKLLCDRDVTCTGGYDHALTVSAVSIPTDGQISVPATPDLTQDFLQFEQLGGKWTWLCGMIKSCAYASFWWVIGGLLLSSLILIVVLCRRRRYSKSSIIWLLWRAKSLYLVIFIAVAYMLVWLHYVASSAKILYALSTLCCIGMLYAYIAPPHDETLIGRIKTIIGFALGMLIIPLALKAYLMQCGL